MDGNYHEWKPDRVKLESELILDNEDRDTNFSAADLDYDGSSTQEPNSSVTQDKNYLLVRIKEEIIEDTSFSADPFLDTNDVNSTEKACAVNENDDYMFSHEKIIIKMEEDFVEENDRNNHLNLDFLDANRERRVKGMSCPTTEFSANEDNNGCQSDTSNSSVITSSSEQLTCLSEPLPVSSNCPVIHLNIASVASIPSNSPTKSIQDSMEATSNRKEISEHRNAQFSSNTFDQDLVKPQAGLTPFELINNVVIKEEADIDRNDCVDETENNARPEEVCAPTPSTSEHTTASFEKTSLYEPLAFQGHSIFDPDRVFTCGTCFAQFKRKDHLAGHLLTHVDRKAFSCDQCPAQFKRQSSLRNHLLLHSDEKKFPCSKCSAKFKTRSQAITHIRNHSDEKVFTCKLCPARFKTSSLLKKHSVVHSSDRAFSCEKCSARFKMPDQLKAHWLTHVEEKAFSCDICAARFKQKRYLDNHLLTHSDKRVFSCNQCSSKFKTRAHLKNHSLTHTDQRAFSCDQCSARFRRSSHLKKHIRSHSGKKMFSCELSSIQCKTKIRLEKHLSKH